MVHHSSFNSFLFGVFQFVYLSFILNSYIRPYVKPIRHTAPRYTRYNNYHDQRQRSNPDRYNHRHNPRHPPSAYHHHHHYIQSTQRPPSSTRSTTTVRVYTPPTVIPTTNCTSAYRTTRNNTSRYYGYERLTVASPPAPQETSPVLCDPAKITVPTIRLQRSPRYQSLHDHVVFFIFGSDFQVLSDHSYICDTHNVHL